MYCYKCGKYIETDETLCPECKAKENKVEPQVIVVEEVITPPQSSVKKPSNKYGIASFVLADRAVIPVFVALRASVQYNMITTLVVSAVIAGLMIVASLLLGIFQIKEFVSAGKDKRKRPVPGFVMGLIGIFDTALVSFMLLVSCLTMY